MTKDDLLATKKDIKELADVVLFERKHENWGNFAYFMFGFVVGVILIIASYSDTFKKNQEKLREAEMEVSSCKFAAHLEIDALEDQLNDPEHCETVCVELFEKYGC